MVKFLNKVILISWSVLGFYRGVERYDYIYDIKKEKKYVISKLTIGIISGLFYIIPITFPIAVYNELTNLKNLLDDLEKNKND
jgi:hypothetical protein